MQNAMRKVSQYVSKINDFITQTGDNYPKINARDAVTYRQWYMIRFSKCNKM